MINDDTRQAPEDEVNNGVDADFEAAFAEFAGATPKVDPPVAEEPKDGGSEGNDPEEEASAEAAPEEEQEEAPAEASPSVTSDEKPASAEEAPAESAPDIWANASPELLAWRAEREKEIETLRHSDASQRNRVAALSRKLATLTTGADKAPAEGGGGQSEAAEPSEAQKALSEKMRQLSEDYPEIAAPLQEMHNALDARLSSIEKVATSISEKEADELLTAQYAALDKVHSDWRDIAASEDWRGWIEAQPEGIRKLAESWDARETSVAISLFKTERDGAKGGQGQKPAGEAEQKQEASAATGAKRSQQLEGGRDVRSKSPAPAASGPPDDFEAAFDHYAQKRTASAKR